MSSPAFENYTIKALLSQSEMSSVYAARNELLDKMVAIKVINSALDDESRRRFLKEAKFCSQMNHDSIVKAIAFGLDKGGRPFMVMEYLEGEDLEQFLSKNGKLSRAQFEQIFYPILDALQYAHEKQLLHRDLKPSNIFICRNENGDIQAKLLDFGIAKDLSITAEQRKTHTGILGSPLYMSPEQCTGKSLDCRSDIYSLACVMYRSLSGAPPFDGEASLETMYKKLNETAPVLSSSLAKAGFNVEFIKLLNNAMNRNPEKRPGSCQIFKKLIEECLSAASPPNKLPMFSAGLALSIAIVLGGSFLIFRNTDRNESKIESSKTESSLSAKSTSSKHGIHLARKLAEAGKFAEARQEYGKLLYSAERRSSEDSLDLRYKIHQELAGLAFKLGEPEIESQEYQKALAVYKEPWSARKLSVGIQYADFLARRGRQQEAIKFLENSAQKAEETLAGTPDNALAEVYSALAKLFVETGKTAKADSYFRKSLETFRLGRRGLCCVTAADAVRAYHELLLELGKNQEAESFLNSCINELDKKEADTAPAMCTLADSLQEFPDLKEQRTALYRKARKYTGLCESPGKGKELDEHCRRMLKTLSAR